MDLNKMQTIEHLVYESTEQGILIAVAKEDQKKIKSFWKKYKGKSTRPNDAVKGYPFIHDEEQDSLKIDFTSENQYAIKDLTKFD